MNILKGQRGFTLLELLVVVGLVAILSAVVITALNTARGRGGDAGVKTNLHTVANQAALFFLNNTSSYLPAGGSTFDLAVCPAYNGSGTNMLSRDSIIAGAIAQAVSNGGETSYCYNSASTWAVAVDLKTAGDVSWCVDSTGASKQVAQASNKAINESTFLCN